MRIRPESGQIRTSTLVGHSEGRPKLGETSEECLFSWDFQWHWEIRPKFGPIRTGWGKGDWGALVADRDTSRLNTLRGGNKTEI